MSPQLIMLLGWACYLGAAAAIITYIIHFAQRQGWKRPWNAAGLFFTSLALSQIPTLFQTATTSSEARAAVIATLCLLAATGLQAFTALRKRKPRADDAARADPGAGTAA